MAKKQQSAAATQLIAQRKLREYTPGWPAHGLVYVMPREEDKTALQLEKNSKVYKVLAIEKCNNERIKPGCWVQVQQNSLTEPLEWGDRKGLLLKEFQIVWVFDKDPRVIQKEMEESLKDNDVKKEHIDTKSPIQIIGGNA